MTSQSLKPGWKMVKFGEEVKNANLMELNPEANGVERIVGLDHIDPENLHVRRWNSVVEKLVLYQNYQRIVFILIFSSE